MKSYINTRSINKDYRYLGAMPDNSWLNVYHELTSFEHSTIICEKDHDQFRLFLSGMPSTRLDKVGTKIRYSFLFVGAPDELSQVAGLVSAWASAIDDNSSLAKKLGELYSEDAVQNMIEHHVFDDDAQNQLMTWLKSFDKTDHTFVNQIHQTQTGVVCYFNFIDDEKDASDISFNKPLHVWLNEPKKFVQTQVVQPATSTLQANQMQKQHPVSTTSNQEDNKDMGKTQAIVVAVIIVVILIITTIAFLAI